ncbi:MAG: CoB--CoM heterodisulfide reductase iron-sulfur subunit B family protein [Methanobrevibacter sp.]|jgi:heterodisulfide reductase subunit B|nr:CoB--CoM heterodisulfide reductase iron-sulfur subunit B family protein [Candidatus Methanovirga aequatorialis]
MKIIPDKNILLFKSCLVSTEYPGIESSTKYIFDQLGVEYIIDHEQSCCSGLGYYSDVFDQTSTTLIAARNFYVTKKNNAKNIAVMCATCYAINKKSVKLLNKNNEFRERINNVFEESSMKEMKYEKGSLNPTDNIFHVVEIFFNKKKEISKHVKIDLSNFKIATHHACHYCKVHYEDTIEGFRNPRMLDELVESLGVKTIDWYNTKINTCGAGFRQRFANKPISMKVTGDKLLELNEQNVDILIHMCPNCQMQFDRYQPYLSKELGVDFNIFHLNITQLIALAIGGDPYKTVGIQTHTFSIEPLIKRISEDTI